MEWIQDDFLLGNQDLRVLSFPAEPKQSTIVAIPGGPDVSIHYQKAGTSYLTHRDEGDLFNNRDIS